jgi:hypothetical protein
MDVISPEISLDPEADGFEFEETDWTLDASRPARPLMHHKPS